MTARIVAVPPRTLPGRLARELVRVAVLRETYRAAQREFRRLGVPDANGPVLLFLDASLEAAMQAADSPDVAGQITAVRDLEGFTE